MLLEHLLYMYIVIFSEQWISDFVDVWIKMSQNGYGNQELVQGPENFWTHL